MEASVQSSIAGVC